MNDNKIINAYFNDIELSDKDFQRIVQIRQHTIDKAMHNARPANGVSFINSFEWIDAECSELLEEKLQDQTLIELGPGHRPLYGAFEKKGISKYIAVEPKIPKSTGAVLNILMSNSNNPDEIFNKTDIKKTDGLSYLIGQPDNSAVVVSFGVLCPELQHGNGLYLKFLAKEIYRVTPQDSITIHAYNNLLDVKNLFSNAGFELQKLFSYDNILGHKRK